MPVVQPDLDFGLNLDLPAYLYEGLDLFDGLNLSPLEEIWKNDWDLTDAWNLPDDSLILDCKSDATMIRVHDCMWAGTCVSKDHVGRRTSCHNDTTQTQSTPVTTTTINGSSTSRCSSNPISIPNSTNRQQTKVIPLSSTSCRSVLKKPSIPAPTKVLHRPDTPQSEDEISGKSPDDHSWSRAVAVSEIAGQRDSNNYVNVQSATAVPNSVSFDHNYNTKKQPKMDDLGVVTPSDSEEDVEETEEEEGEEEEESQSSEIDNEEDEEEEIDVVSLNPSSPLRKRMGTVRKADINWSRREKARMEEWRKHELIKEQKIRMELNRQNQAVKYASQQVSKRLTSETRGRGRQKRKRTTSDEEETYRTDDFVFKQEVYKTHYNRKTKINRIRTNVRRKHTTPSKKTRISTDSETDSTEKRSQHNNMERIRRIELKKSFEDLKSLIPSLSDSAKAAKVTILKEGAAYCQQLTHNTKTLASQVALLLAEQDKLRYNLSKQRRYIANKHAMSNTR